MKPKGLFIIVAVSILLFSAKGWCSDATRTFLDGVQAYEEGDYHRSTSLFSKIVASGIKNGALYYNLANAHMKNKDLGHAILWYERAATLIPDDPDLRFNLDYAASLVKDAPGDATPEILQILFFWKYALGDDMVRSIAIGLNLIFWSMLILYRVLNRRLINPATLTILGLALTFALTTAGNYAASARLRHGIVLAEAVSVRSGLSENATELFVLHTGTRVRIEQSQPQGYRIRFSKDKIGWMKKEALGEV
jgi:tetratricopeptide (TPR) repeat protein